MTAAIALGAFFADCAFGDPRSSLHPVVLMGKLISLLERLLYREEGSNGRKLFSGGVLMALTLAVSYGAAGTLIFFAEKSGVPYASEVLQAIMLSFMISPRALAEAGREIYGCLSAGDMERARQKVGWIVGRDTENLSEGEVTRATVETISENTVDGIVSPLFYFFLGGLPLAVAYRAANTMDSMIGYKNEKYLFFGRAAARFDDAWNYVPARIAGVLFVIAAFILGKDWRGAWRILRRDSAKHPSPNGGWTEATTAGALGIRLGGVNYYFGKPSFRAYMGDPKNALGAGHISEAVKLMYTVTLLFLASASAASFVLRAVFGGGFGGFSA